VLLGGGLAVATLFFMGGSRVFQAGYAFDVRLDSASGLVVGAPVKFAGVDVGEVRSIRIQPEAARPWPVLLSVWVHDEVQLYADDRVLVGMLGILGEKYVEILPGPQRTQPLNAGATLTAQKTVTEVQLTQRLGRVLQGLETALNKLNALKLDARSLDTLQAQTVQTLKRAEALSQRLEQTADRVQDTLGPWQRVGEQLDTTLGALRRLTPWVAAGSVLLLLWSWLLR